MPPGAGYGDQQAFMTMNRAAYGDYQAAMLSGAGSVYGGASLGMQNMFSDIGQHVMPAMYHAPARVYVGSYGQYQQHTSLMSGLMGTVGLHPDVPRGTTALEYGYNMAADAGERVGAGAAAVAGVAAGLGVGATVGRFGGMAVGAAVGSIFGPAGTAVGATVGGFVGGAAGYMATEGAIGSAITQRHGIQNFLEASSFRFTGAGSSSVDGRLGRGMSRETRTGVAEFVRGMDVSDPMMDTGDLTQILQQSSQMGLFTGTSEMDDFKRRFKDITESVKTITKVLHTTLEEGMKTIKDLRGIGMDPSQMGAMAMKADGLGMVAGRTGMEMVSAGLQGAELFRGTGVSMGIGFQSNMMNLAAVRASRDAGTLSQEAVAQAGGEEALAQRMTATSLAFGQSAFGRGTNAAFFNGGAAGPGFNQGAFMQAMMSGGGDFIQNGMSAANNLGNPAGLIKYQANQEKFLSEMGKTFGGQGLQIAQLGAAVSHAQYMANSTGADSRDALILTLKQQGLSMPEIEARLAQMDGRDSVFSASQAGAGTARDKMIIEQAQENMVLNRVGAKVGDVVKRGVDVVARPLNQLIESTGESFIRFNEEQVLGVQRADVRGIDTRFTTAGDRQRAEAARAGRVVDLDRGGWLSTTGGEKIAGMIGSGSFDFLGITGDSISGEGRAVRLNQGQSISRENLETIQRAARNFTVSSSQAEEMQKRGELAGVAGGIGESLLAGKLAGVTNIEGLAQAVYGKSARALSQAEVAKLMVESQGIAPLEKVLDTTRRAFLEGKSAVDTAGVADLRVLSEQFKSQRGELAQALGVGGMDFAGGVAERVAASLVEGVSSEERDRLLAEAAEMQARSGKSGLKDVQSMVAAARSGRGAKVAESLRTTSAGIAMSQRGRSSQLVAEIIETQLAEKSASMSSAELGRATGLADELRSTGFIKDEDRKFLQDNGLAQGYFARRDDIDKLSAELGEISGGGKTVDKEKVKRALEQRGGLRGRELQSAIEKVARGDASGVIKDIETEFESSFAGKTAVGAAGGQPQSVEGGQATAQQVFAQQANINGQILAVMQGLARKLNVQ